MKKRSLVTSALFGGMLLAAPLLPVSIARAQSRTQSVVNASSLPELPLKGWGLYARAHLAPCCLIGQRGRQQFVFPIVVSQQRDMVVGQRAVGTDGRVQTRLTPAVAQRRALGLSPAQGQGDDRAPTGPQAALNRRAQLVEADGDGLLWTTRVAFAPASGAQGTAAISPLPTGGASAWGEGEAVIECFPAFADTGGDGLLIRVTLSNRSQEKQTYGVDLLGSMDTPTPGFEPEGLLVQAQPGQSSALVQHDKCPAVFALAGPSAVYRTHCYRVSDAYFAPAGMLNRREISGAILPDGLLSSALPKAMPAIGQTDDKNNANTSKERNNRDRPKKEAKRKRGDDASEAAPSLPALPLPGKTGQAQSDGQHALMRVDSVDVPPGQSVTLFLSVGVGADGETARDAAQTLLLIANGAATGKTPQPSAYSVAHKAHEAANFASGLPALDRLMAQAFANVPDVDERRIGVGTRQEVNRIGGFYEPARDGLMALGWMVYRPNFAAAQLNAWFQTQTDPDTLSGVPIRNPRATPPTNLFALWELFQRTHDRLLLKRYYPHARRRYLELLAAGRVKEGTGLFAWPSDAQDAVFIPGSLPPGRGASAVITAARSENDKALAAPDYAAYVIASARIMQAIADITDQPRDDKLQYAQDMLETTRALNTALWDNTRKAYVSRPQGAVSASAPRTDTLAGLLPLMAGPTGQTPEQRDVLLRRLTDPALFWSPFGLRSVAATSPEYRPNEGANGAIRFGLNWLFWKALLDAGETQTARQLAVNLLQSYSKAQSASALCPEWLNGDTGAGGGAGDYAGDACALLALWAAYHQPGTLSGGWNVNVLDNSYDRQRETAHIVLKRLDAMGDVKLLCVMGKPGGKYALSGAITQTQTADSDGVLTLTLPQDSTTLVVEVAPEN